MAQRAPERLVDVWRQRAATAPHVLTDLQSPSCAAVLSAQQATNKQTTITALQRVVLFPQSARVIYSGDTRMPKPRHHSQRLTRFSPQLRHSQARVGLRF
jgi:hypothetical protein